MYAELLLHHIRLKGNVFMSGVAGCGKTTSAKKSIIPLLKSLHSEADQVWVAASTGLSAFGIEGTTIHSLSGLGRGKGDWLTLFNAMPAAARKRWKALKVLLIEEISMISRQFLELLDFVGRRIKKNELPFGGVQLVFLVYFHQLPPVPDLVERVSSKPGQPKYEKVPSEYCFESPIWGQCNFKCFRYTYSWRYGNDSRMVQLLSGIRHLDGLKDPEVWGLLKSNYH